MCASSVAVLLVCAGGVWALGVVGAGRALVVECWPSGVCWVPWAPAVAAGSVIAATAASSFILFVMSSSKRF
jgi:hypothetical protein